MSKLKGVGVVDGEGDGDWLGEGVGDNEGEGLEDGLGLGDGKAKLVTDKLTVVVLTKSPLTASTVIG